MPARLDRTRVGIVGGGPAGLSLSHLLDAAGIDHVVLETRARAAIEATHRAGILEQGTVQMLRDMGLGDGVERHGHRHDGIDLRFAGESHRLDFPDLVDAAVWLYPQNEVFADLAAARTRDGADIRWGVSETVVSDHLTSPRVQFREADGTEVTLVWHDAPADPRGPAAVGDLLLRPVREHGVHDRGGGAAGGVAGLGFDVVHSVGVLSPPCRCRSVDFEQTFEEGGGGEHDGDDAASRHPCTGEGHGSRWSDRGPRAPHRGVRGDSAPAPGRRDR